jgi:hypothetical protein
MKSIAKFHASDVWSGAGIFLGMGMLVAGVVVDDLGRWAIPAVIVLVPSLLHGLR